MPEKLHSLTGDVADNIVRKQRDRQTDRQTETERERRQTERESNGRSIVCGHEFRLSQRNGGRELMLSMFRSNQISVVYNVPDRET